MTLSSSAFFVVLIKPFFERKKFQWYELFLALIAIVGFVIIFRSETLYTEGILIALASAFLVALFAVMNSRFIQKYSGSKIAFYELFFAMVFLSLFLLVEGEFTPDFFKMSEMDWTYLLILALVCTAYPFVVATNLLKKMSPFTIVLTNNLEPVYGILLALLIFGDKEMMSLVPVPHCGIVPYHGTAIVRKWKREVEEGKRRDCAIRTQGWRQFRTRRPGRRFEALLPTGESVPVTSRLMADDMPQFRYDAHTADELETRWQAQWLADGTHHAPNPSGPLADDPQGVSGREKLFVLDMFPYPSGTGLHVGHPLGFIGTDVYARFKRMTGHNVLHTMGFDAFGLPAEQYAVETGQHPAITTEQNIATYRRQLRRLGLATTRVAACRTTDPDYYRWTQWIFSQVFNAWYDHEHGPGPPDRRADRRVRVGLAPTPDGRAWAELSTGERARLIDEHRLAYVSEAPVNWCPGWAPWSPTKRSPPTAAATAATSRCSSATCASG